MNMDGKGMYYGDRKRFNRIYEKLLYAVAIASMIGMVSISLFDAVRSYKLKKLKVDKSERVSAGKDLGDLLGNSK